MIDIRIFDKEFGHAKSYSGDNAPKYFRWEREHRLDGPAFFTNRMLSGALWWPGKKIAWLSEPPSLMPNSYKEILALEAHFDYILTYDKSLIARDPKKYLYYPLGGSWIPENVDLSQPKTRLVSMISSSKRGCVGYELRHEIAEALGHRIELFGQIVDKPIKCKTEGLLPFMFSVVVENDYLDDYFTEKLIDCLSCGTIPFYWGSPSASLRFNPAGIIPFESISDLQTKLDLCANASYYKDFQEAVADNVECAKEYRIPENWLWDHYPFLFQ